MFGCTYLGSLVLAGSDEVGAVRGPLEVDDGLAELMNRDVVDEFTGLGVVLAHTAVLVAGDDVLAQVTPTGNGGLALVAHDGELPLVRLLGLRIRVDAEDDDIAQVTHSLLRAAEDLGAILVELDSLDGGGELPGLDVLARLDVPEADGVVGRAGGDHGRCGLDIDGPDGTDVAVVGAETLAIVREPGADLLVLGDGEDDVAVEVVSAARVGRC